MEVTRNRPGPTAGGENPMNSHAPAGGPLEAPGRPPDSRGGVALSSGEVADPEAERELAMAVAECLRLLAAMLPEGAACHAFSHEDTGGLLGFIGSGRLSLRAAGSLTVRGTEDGVAWLSDTPQVSDVERRAGLRTVRVLARIMGRASRAAALSLAGRGLVRDDIRRSHPLGPMADPFLSPEHLVHSAGMDLWVHSARHAGWRLALPAHDALAIAPPPPAGSTPFALEDAGWLVHPRSRGPRLALGPFAIRPQAPPTASWLMVPAGGERPAAVTDARTLDLLWLRFRLLWNDARSVDRLERRAEAIEGVAKPAPGRANREPRSGGDLAHRVAVHVDPRHQGALLGG